VSDRVGKVLILSPHVMTAALVGWYVELARLEPAFAEPGEHPDQAVARVKPILVLLIDSELEAGLSDLLAARAAKRGAGVAVFGTANDSQTGRAWAARHDIRYFELPVDLESFGRVLDLAANDVSAERRQSNRRSSPGTERALDGTLVFIDGTGKRWYVYDRRAVDRRAIQHPYRAFISADGVERRCELTEKEFAAREPSALRAQLEHAAQVPPNHS
jgi:hypothetical protein